MIKAARLLRTIALVTLLTSAALAVGKVTVDPYAKRDVEPKPAVTVGALDKRLDVKIEYDAGNTRLHNVIEDLARMSKVTIYSGASPSDWRIRDMPVTVAARNITLRQLLDCLLCSTHTALASGKTKEGVIFYRIVRDARTKKALDDYEKAVKDYETTYAAWSLRAGSRLAAAPGSELVPPQDYEKAIKDDRAACPAWSLDETAKLLSRRTGSLSSLFGPPINPPDEWWNDFQCKRELSRVFGALDSSAKAKIMSGEPFWLTPKTAPAGLRDALLGFLKAADVNAQFKYDRAARWIASSYIPNGPLPSASPAELENARVRLMRKGSDIIADAGLFTEGTFSSGNYRPVRRQTTSASEIIHAADSYCKGGLDKSGRPKEPEVPEIDPSNPSLTPPNWESPDLPARVNVKLADDKKPKRSADALIALSKATGLTIVCEDFQSHRKDNDVAGKFAAECTLADALEKALAHMKWLTDAKSRVLVGYDCKWTVRHLSLIPGNLVDSVTAKAAGNGADINDLTPLCAFGVEAVSEWLGDIFAFECKQEDLAAWAFYDSLSADRKTLAKSSSGLALGGLDLTLLRQWLKEKARADTQSIDHPDRTDGAVDWNRLSDPRVLSTLVMRLTPSGAGWGTPAAVRSRVLGEAAGSPAARWNASGKSNASDPAGIHDELFKGYYCSLVIDAVQQGRSVGASVEWPGRLPYFSAERSKEVDELRRKKDAVKGP